MKKRKYKKRSGSWNKGLTKETDERVAKYSEKLKDRKLTDKHKENIGKVTKGRKYPKGIYDERAEKLKGHLFWGNENNFFKEGKSNINWRGGINKDGHPFEFNKKLKLNIRKRDNYTCQECGMTEKELGYKLACHHIDYNKMNNNEDNLISLCRSCHAKTGWNRKDWIKYYKEKIMETLN